MEYYSTIKKKVILVFMTKWMGLKGVMLSEINQTKTNTLCFHSDVGSKKMNEQNENKNKIGHREQISGYKRGSWLWEGGCEMGEVGQSYGDRWQLDLSW